MLNMNPVVEVNVSIEASSKVSTVFDIGAILTSEAGAEVGTGTGEQLSTTNRFVLYSSISELLNGVEGQKPVYADTTETYKAAAKYFNVDPAPKKLLVMYFDGGAGTPESPVDGLADCLAKGAEFYGLYYIPKPSETAAHIVSYTSGLNDLLVSVKRGVQFCGFTGTVSSAIADGTVPKTLYSGNAERTICMYCTSEANDAAGLMGVAMGYSVNADTSPFALCYKKIASATANSITEDEVDSIKAINANVFVARTKSGARVECGSASSGLRFDEILYIDMIAASIQENLYDLIADSPTKLPMTDATTALLSSEICRILEGYYGIGVLADNAWRGAPIGEISAGDMIEHGYTVFADSFDMQSAEDRAAHKSMPITVLICMSGAVESVVINLDVQT